MFYALACNNLETLKKEIEIKRKETKQRKIFKVPA